LPEAAVATTKKKLPKSRKIPEKPAYIGVEGLE